MMNETKLRREAMYSSNNNNMSKAMKKDSMKASLITLGVFVTIGLLVWGGRTILEAEVAKAMGWMSAFL